MGQTNKLALYYGWAAAARYRGTSYFYLFKLAYLPLDKPEVKEATDAAKPKTYGGKTVRAIRYQMQVSTLRDGANTVVITPGKGLPQQIVWAEMEITPDLRCKISSAGTQGGTTVGPAMRSNRSFLLTAIAEGDGCLLQKMSNKRLNAVQKVLLQHKSPNTGSRISKIVGLFTTAANCKRYN